MSGERTFVTERQEHAVANVLQLNGGVLAAKQVAGCSRCGGSRAGSVNLPAIDGGYQLSAIG